MLACFVFDLKSILATPCTSKKIRWSAMPFNASVIWKINGTVGIFLSNTCGTGSVPYVGNKHELNDMNGAYRNL